MCSNPLVLATGEIAVGYLDEILQQSRDLRTAAEIEALSTAKQSGM